MHVYMHVQCVLVCERVMSHWALLTMIVNTKFNYTHHSYIIVELYFPK